MFGGIESRKIREKWYGIKPDCPDKRTGEVTGYNYCRTLERQLSAPDTLLASCRPDACPRIPEAPGPTVTDTSGKA